MMHERRVGRRFARAGAVTTLAFVLVGVGASAASAHATVKTTSPPQSAVFKSGAGPRVVVVGFDEPVIAQPTFLKVYDGAGKPVTGVQANGVQKSAHPQATLPALPDGTYHEIDITHIPLGTKSTCTDGTE